MRTDARFPAGRAAGAAPPRTVEVRNAAKACFRDERRALCRDTGCALRRACLALVAEWRR